jgi:hypothetical protein
MTCSSTEPREGHVADSDQRVKHNDYTSLIPNVSLRFTPCRGYIF